MEGRDGSAETSTLDLRREAAVPILHKRIYGSVEALEGEERLQRNRRFRIETSTATDEVMPQISYIYRPRLGEFPYEVYDANAV